MRTKTTLLTAALVAAGAATSMAQVYSLNVVGYINVTLTNGFQMVSCPLVASPDNTLNTIMPAANLPANLAVYTFSNVGGYSSETVNVPRGGGANVWSGGGTTPIGVGQGAFVFLPGPTGTSLTVTFVGTVQQASGSTPTPIPAGFSIVSSQVPLAGGLTSVLGYNPNINDVVYTYDPTLGYSSDTFQTPRGGGPGVWSGGSEPVIGVAQSFFLQAAASGSWANNFTVH